MSWLIKACFSHARTTMCILIMFLLAGASAYQSIPKESDPDIAIPLLYVSMHLDGISPEDSERLLVKPMENALKSIEGIKEMSSTAYLGGGNVTLKFHSNIDLDEAKVDVREKMDEVKGDLPADTDEPTLNEINLSLLPVLIVSLSGEIPEKELLRLTKKLQDRIESIPSVLEAGIVGSRDEMIELLIDPLMIESYGLDAVDIVGKISRSNILVAAGTQDTGKGRFNIKVPGLFTSVADIMDMPIKTSGDSVIRIRDIASIRGSFKDRTSYARMNGEQSFALEIKKRTGENIISTIEKVRAAVAEETANWPPAVQIAFSQDSSSDIKEMLKDLQNNVISAILLVLIVCVAALGWRSALLVGIAVPGSFLTGILILANIGLTVNVVVLFSLILATGMLVDGAIVVTEYAEREMSQGKSRFAAYLEASNRMFWPITASTATTLAAFLPLVFWPGIIGEFMKYMPITLLLVLGSSLIMALIFIPTIGSLIGKPNSEYKEDNELAAYQIFYSKILRFCLRRPVIILLLTFSSLILTIIAYSNFGRGNEFFPDVEPNQAIVHIHGRGNLSIEEKDKLVRRVEERIYELNDKYHEIENIFVTSQTSAANNQAEDVIGSAQIEFVNWQKRRPATEIFDDIRSMTQDIEGVRVKPQKPASGPQEGKPIQIQVSSINADRIQPAVLALQSYLETRIDLKDIDNTLPLPGIEWQIDVDRAQASKFSADISTIGQMIKLVTNGVKFGGYRSETSDDELDIIARFPTEYRTLDQLDNLRLVTPQGSIPLSLFIKRTPVRETGNITRIDSKRVISVNADVQAGELAPEIIKELEVYLQDNGMENVNYHFAGDNEEQKQTEEFLGGAFLITIAIMAIILITQFNSFYNAFIILSAIVLSTTGVLLGLLITNQPFGIVMGGIGIISLAGIVVNNNIVLIDTYDHFRKEVGLAAEEALIKTGIIRLRPVLLTTTTTILGLMPMVLKMNIDFADRSISFGAPSTQWWVQLSTTIVFGLAFATILTLMITPCALFIRDRRRDRKKEKTVDETVSLYNKDLITPSKGLIDTQSAKIRLNLFQKIFSK